MWEQPARLHPEQAAALSRQLARMIEASNAGKAGPAQHRSEEASPPAPSTPGFVRCCLRAKKYEVGRALQLASNYAHFRARTGWGGASVRAAALRQELRSGLNLLLPYPDAEGNVVLTQTMRRMLLATCRNCSNSSIQ